MEKVWLERGEAKHRSRLDALVQLYIHDFADFLPPERRFFPGEDGRLPVPPDFGAYWSDADREVWFIRLGDQVAGFALVNHVTHSGLPADHNMGEFFVARPCRRARVGELALAELVRLRPGLWEAATAARNLPAQQFWAKAVQRIGAGTCPTIAQDGSCDKSAGNSGDKHKIVLRRTSCQVLHIDKQDDIVILQKLFSYFKISGFNSLLSRCYSPCNQSVLDILPFLHS